MGALEFYTGTGGGSTLLVADAMARHLPSSFYSVERDPMNVGNALKVLRSIHIPATWRRMAARVNDTAMGTLILHGESTNMSLSPAEQPLTRLCKSLQAPVDLIVLDAAGEFAWEWQIIEPFCRPRSVAIHN